MRAIRFHEHGGPEVLRPDDVPVPEPGPGEVLIRVRACALNHLDLWQRRGIPGVPLPHAPGSDISGEVARSDTAGCREGQRVMLQPGLSCGRCVACLSGQDNFCPSYDIIGYRSEGGYAEFVTVPAANVVAIPDRIGFHEAAAFPLTFLTAWHMLVTRAQVQPGESVLVLAAGSGVGQAAIQIARLIGARVIATAGSDEKLARARALGAAAGINHYTQDIADEVRKLTARRGVEVVCEHVGQATWDQCVKSLARGGRLVTCGATTGPSVSIDERVLFARQISLLGSYMGTKGELLRAAAFFFAGQLTPAVDKVYPLAAAADAHRRLEQKEQFGKVILEP